MAATIDSSSPIRFSVNDAPGSSMSSASFTAPANSLLVLCVEHDCTELVTLSVDLTTGGALTWVNQVERLGTEGTAHGAAYIRTAVAATSEVRVVRVTSSWTNASTLQRSAKLYVVQGADLTSPVPTVTASNEGSNTNNTFTTTSLTPDRNGLLFAAACDWTAGGGSAAYDAATDGSTQSTVNFSGLISVVDGYKTASSGSALGMTLSAGGTATADHAWCQILVREAESGTTHTDVAWGATGSPVAEDPIAWNASPGGWKRESDGGAVTVTGDASWGTLIIASGEPVVSDVIDTGDANSKTFTLDYNVYDSGGTPGVIQIRGSATTFAWDAGSPGPEWANYTAPTAQSWQYVQVRLAYS